MQRSAASPKPSDFARRLLVEWNQLGLVTKMEAAETPVVVGVSGGGDSVALLLAIDELVRAERLGVRVVVAHLNHDLRGETAARNAEWVVELARNLSFEAVSETANLHQDGAARDNLEQSARRVRYQFFADVARRYDACAVLVAHTLDDQAETVLLRLVRGSGAEGLSAMRAVRPLDVALHSSDVVNNRGTADGRGTHAERSTDEQANERREVWLVRPLLEWARRADTTAYCEARGVTPLTDAMNDDVRFRRVRVRRELLPLLREFNPRIVETLARTARLLYDDHAALEREAAPLLERARGRVEEGDTLIVKAFAGVAPAIRRRALRCWITEATGSLRRIEEVHVAALEKLLTGERGGRVVELPGGNRVERRKGVLRFIRARSL